MERAVPNLPGDDIRVAKEFYAGALGFSVRFEATEDGRTGLIGFERGGLCITVDCPMSGHGRNACAVFEVDDADAYYEEWHTKVAIPRPPMHEVWDARTFGVQDPFGNTLFVIGPPR